MAKTDASARSPRSDVPPRRGRTSELLSPATICIIETISPGFTEKYLREWFDDRRHGRLVDLIAAFQPHWKWTMIVLSVAVGAVVPPASPLWRLILTLV